MCPWPFPNFQSTCICNLFWAVWKFCSKHSWTLTVQPLLGLQLKSSVLFLKNVYSVLSLAPSTDQMSQVSPIACSSFSCSLIIACSSLILVCSSLILACSSLSCVLLLACFFCCLRNFIGVYRNLFFLHLKFASRSKVISLLTQICTVLPFAKWWVLFLFTILLLLYTTTFAMILLILHYSQTSSIDLYLYVCPNVTFMKSNGFSWTVMVTINSFNMVKINILEHFRIF